LKKENTDDRKARSAVLKNRPFLLLWTAQAISQTAQNVMSFVLLIEVAKISRSSIQTSLVILCFMLPAILVGPVAGVFVDRLDKRQVLVSTNLLRAGVALIFILINTSWPVALALAAIYAVSVMFSTISQFFAPAEAATIPLLVAGPQLNSANSLFNLTFVSSQVVGFAFLGPLLVKLATPRIIFLVVSGFYAACTLLVAFLPALHEGVVRSAAGVIGSRIQEVWDEVVDLWKFVARERNVATAIANISLTTSVFLMLGTLGVGLLMQAMGLPASDLAYIVSAGGIGMLAGLWLVPRLAHRLGSKALITPGLAAMGTAILGMAIANPIAEFVFRTRPHAVAPTVLIVEMGLAAVIGIGSVFVNVPSQTLLQESASPSIRGRIFAMLFAVSAGLSVIPVLFAGAIADLVGVQEVMGLIGILTLVVAAVRRVE